MIDSPEDDSLSGHTMLVLR